MNFEVVYNKALKIFSKLYVGVKPSSGGSTPLAFATPYEDTVAGRKRQDTVKSWVGTTRSIIDPNTGKWATQTYEPDIRMLENIPRAAFKVTDDVKRVYWGGGNVVWRIEDPSGWEVEIQSNNLMALIQGVGISAGGEINGECIWARDGAHNVLIPVSSQEYKDAVKAFETVKAPSKIPLKDRVIGRFYRLQDGTFGQYFGKFYITELNTGERGGHANLGVNIPGVGRCGVSADVVFEHVLNGEQEQYEALYIPPYEMDVRNYKYTMGGELKLYKSAALVSELDQGSIQESEVLKIISENKLQFAGNKSTTPVLATRHKPVDVTIDFVPISDERFKEVSSPVLKNQEQVLERHAYHFAQGYNVGKPPKLSVVDMFAWKRVCLLEDDQFYVFSRTVYKTHTNEVFSDVIGRVRPRDGNRFGFVKPKDYHAQAWVGGAQPWNSPDQISNDGRVLPRFDTIDEMKTYLTGLHSAKKLLEQKYKEVQQ